jgi:hypothetical protein
MQGVAYPPSDRSVRNYFMEAPGVLDIDNCKDYIRSFFWSMFTTGQRKLGALLLPVQKYEDIVNTIHKHFSSESLRTEFYEEVVKTAKAAGNQGDRDLEESFRQFEATLKSHCSDWLRPSCATIILSLDEVHVLYHQRVNDTPSSSSLYSQLKSVMSELVAYDLCMVTLSTVGAISKLAPSKEEADSLREKAEDRILPNPFTELSFDIHIRSQPLVAGSLTLDSVGSLEFTAKFGRPLWVVSFHSFTTSQALTFRFYSTYLSRTRESRARERHFQTNTCNTIMRIVRAKLSGRSEPCEAATLTPGTIAILSARFLLDINPTSINARAYEEKMVRSHLRIAYSVSRANGTMVTGNSPEPLVAEGSAQLMHMELPSNNGKKYMNVWDLLVQYCEGGLLPQGTIGELLGRALSIFAMDRAIEATRTKCQLKYQTPVKVLDYYKALLTDQAWETLRTSRPANRQAVKTSVAKKSFEEAFADAYLHFSHYSKAHDEGPMTDVQTWALWLRGTAISCQLNQELTDRSIPIFFSKINSKTQSLSPASMSILLEQDKSGVRADPVLASPQSVEVLKIFTEGKLLPYIATVHCYSLEPKGLHTPPSLSYNLRHDLSGTNGEAPRYQLDFYGLNAYRGVTEKMTKEIRTLLDRSKNAVFGDNVRSCTLNSLQMMLPVTSKKQAANLWYEPRPEPSDSSKKRPHDAEVTMDGVVPTATKRSRTQVELDVGHIAENKAKMPLVKAGVQDEETKRPRRRTRRNMHT